MGRAPRDSHRQSRSRGQLVSVGCYLTVELEYLCSETTTHLRSSTLSQASLAGRILACGNSKVARLEVLYDQRIDTRTVNTGLSLQVPQLQSTDTLHSF